MLEDMVIETVEAEIVTDTATAARKTTMAVGKDITRATGMMIHAANEGTSVRTASSVCWVGSLDF